MFEKSYIYEKQVIYVDENKTNANLMYSLLNN